MTLIIAKYVIDNCLFCKTVESDCGPEKQFEGEIDLGKELALLHRLLVENLKEMNEVLIIYFIVETLCS